MDVTTEVRLLGPLEVERAGALVSIGSAKQRRLLCELAIADGTVVSIDRLVAVLWDDGAPDSARNSLQSHVARLRLALDGPELIVTHPGGYALDAGVVATDLRRFTRAVVSARELVDTDPEAAALELDNALSAWRGDALTDFDDPAARAQATRLHGVRADAGELLAAARTRSGDPAGALDALEAVLLDDPFRETAVAARARCLATLGRVPDALASLRQYRARLAEELGLTASEHVSVVEQELLRGESSPIAIASALEHDSPDAGARPALAEPARPPRLGTPTVGRSTEADRIDAALAASPLVTLVGPGGVGKTRLAAEAANRANHVAWIDLSATTSSDDVAPAIVDGLGPAAPRDAQPASLVRALRRFDGLVVLDNCEHVVDGVAHLLDEVLAAQPHVRLLATSRERLDLAGELVIPITPLAVPDPPTATAADPAIALFLDRAEAAGGDPISPRDAAQVVAAVDGLPLAIELAAARSVALPVPDLVDRLRDNLDVLSGTRRRRGDRHRTLSHVIAWSYDLLPDVEKVLFRRLSVFTATFDLHDLEQVCCDASVPTARAAEALAHLVESSMVMRAEHGRHRLLVPIRLFAARLLADSDEGAAVRERQRVSLLHLADRADADMYGPDEVAVAAAVDRALPDLRAVHARALADGDLATVAALASRLYRYAYMRMRTDLLRWGAALLPEVESEVDADVDATDRARALAAATAAAWMSGDYAQAQELAEAMGDLPEDSSAATDVAEAHGDLRLGLGDLDGAAAAYTAGRERAEHVDHDGLVARADANATLPLLFRGDDAAARTRAEASVRRAETAGSPSVQSLAHYALGETQVDNEPDAAIVSFQQSRRLAESSGARLFAGLATTAEVALRGRHGDPVTALEQYAQALRLWLDGGADGLVLTALRNLVTLLTRIGADGDALAVHLAIERLATKPTYGDEERRVEQAVRVARQRLDEDGAARATDAAGRIDDIRSAVTFALDAIARALRDGSPVHR